MTTKGRGAQGLIVRLVLALPILLVAWLAILALVLRMGAPAPAVLVLFPPRSLIGALGDASITGGSAISLTLRSDAPYLAARAYASGAWMVLPAGLEACIPAFLRETGPAAEIPTN